MNKCKIDPNFLQFSKSNTTVFFVNPYYLTLFSRLHNLINGVFLGRNMVFSSRSNNQSSNQQIQGIKVAHILNNRQVCFANQKLPRALPRRGNLRDRYLDVINTFIMFMNHKNQNRNVVLQGI